MADLKPRQYKRLGRIEERNPERAAKVAGRMEKRATREERGKAVAKSASEGNKGIRGKLVTAQRTAAENDKIKARYSRDEEKGTTALIKRMARTEAKPVNVVRGKINRPDTPLAMTPEPYADFRK